MQELIITKQIAKQGSQSIIVLPKVFENILKPRDLVEVRIKLVQKYENQSNK
ncbi:MAG: hypothetical protein KKC75_03480 [Nanoarchaeota archaeon]|nr:hypothetical protein [Nanoarchaeota archaeon]MBU1004195.1 hypothetical protein [Nanoarchaeota archaeon]MBU1945353.1 hypothetical protein [Nanoarchaeota archaeon]